MNASVRFVLPLVATALGAVAHAADKDTARPLLHSPQSIQTPAPRTLMRKNEDDTREKNEAGAANPVLTAPKSLKQPAVQKASPQSGEERTKHRDGTPKTRRAGPASVPVPLNVNKQNRSGTPLPAMPGNLRKAKSAGERRDLPQAGRPDFAPKADTVEIKLSGVGIYEGSAVGGDNGEMLTVGAPGIIVMVKHGTLRIHGVVPGERDTYDYYLIVQQQSAGPGSCRVDPRLGHPTDVVADKPDIEGDGKVRVIGSGWNRQIRNVTVHQGDVLEKYYIRLCVVGKNPDTGEATSISSNVTQLAVIPE